MSAEQMQVDEKVEDGQVPTSDTNAVILREIPNMTANGMNEIIYLKRFCYLGSFEPVYIHLRRYIDVKKFWPIVKALVEKIDDKKFMPFIRDILQDVSLVRRDEVLFVYAVYLASSVDIIYKTALRISFSVLIETDEDLFLFCKYTSLIAAEQNRKCFSRTVRKAIKAWYARRTEDEIRSMWVAHRGLHGFTHKTLIKLCRINDAVVGSAEIVSPFFRTCTELLKKEVDDEVEPKRKVAEPSTSTGACSANEPGEQAHMAIVQQKTLESPIPSSIIAAVSKLRTTSEQEDAVKIIQKFKLSCKHVPGYMLRYSDIIEAVLPTMSYLEILKCWRKMIQFQHFRKNKKVFGICQNMLGNIDFAKKHRIYPVHLLMRLHSATKKPLRRLTHRKLQAMNLDYLDNLYKQSFNWPVETGNLRMFITVNLQKGYKKKFLKNHKKVSFFEAAFALAFGFLKREHHVDIYSYVESKTLLEKIPVSKTLTTEMGIKTFASIDKKKSSQRLATSIAYALGSEQIYDVFLCIVPRAGRSNPKKKSKYLARLLDKYRQEKNPNAKFIILSLLKIKPRSMQYSATRVENILEICSLDEHTIDLIYNFANGRFD